MSEHKRRNFLIKKALQVRLIIGYFFFVISGGMFFILLMGIFTTESMTISYSYNDSEMVQTPFALLRQSLISEWPYLLLGSLLLIVVAIRVTHRVAGPLYRFEQTLDTMLAGDLSDTIALRSKDEGKELAAKLNTFNQGMSNSIRSMVIDSNAVRELLMKAHQEAAKLPEEHGRELQSLLWSIEEKNKKIETASQNFTLRKE